MKKEHKILMNDQAVIYVLERGIPGKPAILLVPGLSGTVESYFSIIDDLDKTGEFHILAMDFRSHGGSERTKKDGMRIARLSKDLQEVITAFGLDQISLLGHSMGCGVIWSYIELFGEEKITSLIFVDQPPTVMSSNLIEHGYESQWSVVKLEDAPGMVDRLRDPEHFIKVLSEHFEYGFVTKDALDQLELWLANAEDMDPASIARLMFDSLTRDWTDMIHTITKPTLVIGGEVSMVPWQSQAWISKQIKNAQLKIFTPEEAGSHCMFLEPAGRAIFNQTLTKFLLD
ncbi:MAG: alpha/beta hydrolase [Deltaproteobacteria bacterium]|nr:alpha/beta hydrolase [Deltaproteobacteria bacterium]MBT4266825.1 alpha/beta hydrolase [Deltaproteobacteria bacterium]MBT4640860.1 alpha/beta hydrolase [Deltaproteobacteria bacterium]MBT6502381.1 alpha/beta hydrolase [Deltaproteobacteria bacterium]MBT6610493.1 alpha/beta hydrolase [Deltaproteobacteria bacterium]